MTLAEVGTLLYCSTIAVQFSLGFIAAQWVF